MNIIYAILFGIVQGLTEFIPVSSTAHLLITQKLLGIASGDATFSFLVLVQLGTILSLILFFWKDLLELAIAAKSMERSSHQDKSYGLSNALLSVWIPLWKKPFTRTPAPWCSHLPLLLWVKMASTSSVTAWG